jgi:small subunit ribosomal protein S17
MAKRLFKGKVIKNKMEKTAVVEINVPKKHRFYSKDIKLTKNVKAHDTLGCLIGDLVFVEESKPMGKKVTWVITEKISEAKEVKSKGKK